MSAEAILAVLDKGCDAFVFPMLDNGYVYLAATRLTLFRSADDWAMAFEIFGYAPRAAGPDVSVWALGSRLARGRTRADHATQAAYDDYLEVHPHDNSAFFSPIGGNWQDAEWGELGQLGRHLRVGSRTADRDPRSGDLRPPRDRAGRTRPRPDLPALPVPGRRRARGRPRDGRRAPDPRAARLDEFLVLDDWHHPDTVTGERASDTAAFRSLATALASGDVAAYDASEEPNTHWSNWPFGGSL